MLTLMKKVLLILITKQAILSLSKKTDSIIYIYYIL